MGDKIVKIIISIVIIVIIIFSIPFIYLFFLSSSNKTVFLNNTDGTLKEEIIDLMDLKEVHNEIELIKVERPEVYRDIYYKIYFILDNNDNNILGTIRDDDIYGRDFKNVKDNEYSCTIYRLDDVQIDLLENLFKEKWN